MKQSQLHELRKYAGDLSGLYGMKEYCYTEGKARGMRAIELNNGAGLVATLLPDRCLDIPYLSYRGTNIGLVTKVGVTSPAYYNPNTLRGFLRQFTAGFLTTCGLMNAGPAREIDGQYYPMHGEISNTPATCVNKEELVVDDNIVLQVSAQIKEASVFGEHLVLHRVIRLETERNALHIIDTLENRGFSPAPLMNLYHINFGYPLLNAGAKVYFSTTGIAPRDENAREGLARHAIMEIPEPGLAEQCFIHTGGSGAQFAMLHNEALGLAGLIRYNIDDLPFLVQWKSMSAGDYALGLEPSAAGLWGSEHAKEQGFLKYLEPGESKTFSIQAEILDDAKAIQKYISECNSNG